MSCSCQVGLLSAPQGRAAHLCSLQCVACYAHRMLCTAGALSYVAAVMLAVEDCCPGVWCGYMCYISAVVACFSYGPNLQIAMSPGSDPHGAAARLGRLSAYAALELLVEQNDMKPSSSFTGLGAQDLRELYGLMLRGLPWSYIDLILYAMIFKLPEHGPWMDMVSPDTLHFVELFCGVAHMLLVCTLHLLTGLSIGCVLSLQFSGRKPSSAWAAEQGRSTCRAASLRSMPDM